MPARERRGLHGGGRCQGDGKTRGGFRQPRAGSDQRVDRRARCRAGRGAAGAVYRPGAALGDRAQIVPGGRLRQDLRRHGEGRLRHPGCSTGAGDGGARVRGSAGADAGTRRGRVARGHAGGQHGLTCCGAGSGAERRAGLARRYRGHRGTHRQGGAAAADGGRHRARHAARTQGTGGCLGSASPAGGADVQATGLLPQHASQLRGAPRLQDPEAGGDAVPGGRPHHRGGHAPDGGDHAGLHAAGLARAGAAAGPHPRRSALARPELRGEQGAGGRPYLSAGGAGPHARQGSSEARPRGSRSSTSRSRRR